MSDELSLVESCGSPVKYGEKLVLRHLLCKETQFLLVTSGNSSWEPIGVSHF
jgi:hypothetical protein